MTRLVVAVVMRTQTEVAGFPNFVVSARTGHVRNTGAQMLGRIGRVTAGSAAGMLAVAGPAAAGSTYNVSASLNAKHTGTATISDRIAAKPRLGRHVLQK